MDPEVVSGALTETDRLAALEQQTLLGVPTGQFAKRLGDLQHPRGRPWPALARRCRLSRQAAIDARCNIDECQVGVA